MINLVPVGQLDGGHVAYALLGERQNRYSGYIHLGLVGPGIGVCAFYGLGSIIAHQPWGWVVTQAQSGALWFVLAIMLYVIKRLGRVYHPPAPDPTPLGTGRIAVGMLCLLLFVLLFMPVPLRVIQL
jgi:membrane-associated protease RseP (regulator of RpoE activity)